MSATLPIRDDLRSLRPYRWQEGVPEGAVLRFDMNTQPFPPPWYARSLARLARVDVQSYPDATYRHLRQALSAYTGHPPEQIVPTAGADEALVLCALLALRPGERAFARRPCYGLYETATRLAGGELSEEPDGARLTWICSPHNPTGADAAEDELEPRDGLVVIDQAYVEFGGRDLAPLVRERANTVVVRSMSKAFALAGARVGYVLAPAALAQRLDAIRLPAGISATSAALAELALEHLEDMRAAVATAVAERERMAAALRAARYVVSPSHANFLLVDAGEPAAALAARLRDERMVVRTFSDPRLSSCVRISPGTPQANDLLLAALGAAPPPAPRVSTGRTAAVERRTRETDVRCSVDLDGTGSASVATGVGILDHLLGALAFHSLVDLELRVSGDLWIDAHHTAEDAAIALGTAIDRALGERHGIVRFGDARAPLDEALARATVDLGGRGFATVDLELRAPALAELSSSVLSHALETLARSARMALHLQATGRDDHHVAEAAFKALALALRQALALDPRRAAAVPSTKGAL